MKRLTHDEFMKLVGARVKAAGSQKTFAESANISEQYLGDILKGRRAPGPKILNSLGMREVRLYETIREKDEG